MTNDAWPALRYSEWKDTYATLHMWSQVVGKIALAHAAPLNHCWGSALHLTGRGLATNVLHGSGAGGRAFTIAFDFVDHRVLVEVADGEHRSIALGPRSVADFYAEMMSTLQKMGLPTRIWPMPVEIPSPIRFDQDTTHRSYDAESVNRFWRVLLRVGDALNASRCRFIGKASPLNFYWGSFDLALTRFSGRPAPPREGPAFMRDAYSHEVISHGFWPGNDAVPEPVFYAYAVPEPPGFKEARVGPDDAHYSAELGEFLLPYEAVRTSRSASEALQTFVESTYAAGATLGGWDRTALERTNP